MAGRSIMWLVLTVALVLHGKASALLTDDRGERYESSLPVDTPTLVIQHHSTNSNTEGLLCKGLPTIVVVSDRFESNHACFASKSTAAKRLSCTCLTGFTNSMETWVFRLTAATDETISTQPPLVSEGEAVYSVGALLILTLPETVKTLRLLGQDGGAMPVKVRLLSLIFESQQAFPALVDDAPFLETIAVDGIDLSDAVMDKAFVPRTLQTLVLNRCLLNPRTISFPFLASIPMLTSLTLTNNKLIDFKAYVQTLPNLTALSLSNNPIANYSVTFDMYERIKSFTSFELDQPAATTACPHQWLDVGNTKLCVSPDPNGASQNASVETVTNEPVSSSSPISLTIILSGVGTLFAMLLGILVYLVRRRRARKQPIAGAFSSPLKSIPYDPLTEKTALSHDQRVSDLTTPSLAILDHPTIQAHFIDPKQVRISKCISSGGFGVVYNGRLDRRRVAIKSLLPHLAIDPEAVALFVEEIGLLASLHHPRIVAFLGVSLDEGRNLCTIMELMEAGNLHDVLQRYKEDNETMTWATQKATIALQIAEAMVFLHSRSPKVIHRDLKSPNVLLTASLDAKLTDFGISRQRLTNAPSTLTAAIGTTQWMAPEVLMGEQYDQSSDVFSFGVVLAEIDTDDYPTWQRRPSAVSHEVDVTNSPDLSSQPVHHNLILRMAAAGHLRPTLTSQCPRAIVDLVGQCVRTEPTKRPSFVEIVKILQCVHNER